MAASAGSQGCHAPGPARGRSPTILRARHERHSSSRRMVPVQVWSLSSGSSGNAYLLRDGDTHLLVDCGLALRTLEGRLAAIGVAPAALTAVLVTHEHSDHLGGVPALVRRYGLPLYATAGTLRAAASRLPAGATTCTVTADR